MSSRRRAPAYTLRIGPVPIGGPHVQIRIDDELVAFVPEHLTAVVETDTFVADIRTCIGDDLQPAIEAILVRRKDGAAPISPGVLRALNLGSVLRDIVERGSTRWKRDPDNPTRVWLAMSDEQQRFHPRVPEARALAFRRGRPPATERIADEVKRFAEEYNAAIEAGHHAPVAHTMNVLGMTRRTASRRKQAAQERGLIR
jgi:hypothetical protein